MTQEQEQKLNSVAQELALFQINELARNNELEKRLKTLSLLTDSQKALISALDLRISALELARKQQIALNQDLIEKTKSPAKLEIKTASEPKSPFWRIFDGFR